MNKTTQHHNVLQGGTMPKEWSAFRITLVLYLVILLLPLSFYVVSNAFVTMQTDTKVLRTSSRLPGAMLVADTIVPPADIDKMIGEISPWVQTHKHSEYYIGGRSLMQDFTTVKHCWVEVRAQKVAAQSCYEDADRFANIVEKMVYLQQKKITNLFYISLSIAMILTLLTVYLVRIYIRQQIRKHAIHDHETGLYNQKYCLAELKSTCARSVRYDYPLSLLSISIANLFENTYEEKERQRILKSVGGLLTALTRDSDVVCRYSRQHILILLPFTEKENSELLIERIQNTLNAHDFMVDPKPEFRFSVTKYARSESADECIRRAEALLEKEALKD